MKQPAVLLPLALLACNKSPSVTVDNASAAEVGARVNASGVALHLTPGNWVSTVKIDRMTMPGVPPAIAAQMQQRLAQTHTSATCLTPEQASKPAAEFFSGKRNDQCRYDHFSMDGGNIDARMTCREGAQAMAVSMAGTYGAESFHLTMTTKSGSTAAGSPPMPEMAMTVDAKRAGACQPGQH